MGVIRNNLKRNLGYYLSVTDISQKELAEKLGVSQAAVTNWIKGNNSPDIEMVASICEVLKVPVDELFGTQKEGQLNEVEREVLRQYRLKIDMRHAVHVLLGIKEE